MSRHRRIRPADIAATLGGRLRDTHGLPRVLFYGGRDYPHRDRVTAACEAVFAKRGPFVMVTGGCPTGADMWAELWALWAWYRCRGVDIEVHPADWSTHGKAAGPIRNQAMADSGLDGAVQFPGGRGTADMRRRLDAAGISVWERS